jgi:hypothetical protein
VTTHNPNHCSAVLTAAASSRTAPP